MTSCHRPSRLYPVLLLVLLTGCASMPEPLRDGPEHGPDPAQVRAASAQYMGMAVRWGGMIARVDNGPAESVVEIVARPLSGSGRPRETDQTAGRFLARITGFIDPAVYATGREFTLVGTIEGTERRNIGEHPYTYPVVRATGHYLWPARPALTQEPFYHPPFHRWPYYYDPWYPYGPYPYR